jgi:hypothetical protein
LLHLLKYSAAFTSQKNIFSCVWSIVWVSAVAGRRILCSQA